MNPLTFMATCETIEKFPVVILYDHFSSVKAAMKTYANLARELAGWFCPQLRTWRLETAPPFEFSAQAWADLARAEVIIVTVRGDQPWAKGFLPSSAYADQGGFAPPHAIVVYLDNSEEAYGGEDADGSVDSTVTRIHPEVFFCEDAPPQEMPAVHFEYE